MGKYLYGIELEFSEVRGYSSLEEQTGLKYNRKQKRYERIVTVSKNKFSPLKGRINGVITDLGFEAEWEPDDVCLELKSDSPKVWGSKERTKIRLLCERLKDPYFNFEIEPSWNGLHVHVDIQHLSVKQVKNLMRWVEIMEPHYRKILPKKRSLSYCSKTTFVGLDKEYDTVSDLILNAYLRRGEDKYCDIEDFVEEKQHNKRYHGANFHSYLIRGSVEFRWFPSTLESDEIIFAIDSCVNLVKLAKHAPPSDKEIISNMNKLLKLKDI